MTRAPVLVAALVLLATLVVVAVSRVLSIARTLAATTEAFTTTTTQHGFFEPYCYTSSEIKGRPHVAHARVYIPVLQESGSKVLGEGLCYYNHSEPHMPCVEGTREVHSTTVADPLIRKRCVFDKRALLLPSDTTSRDATTAPRGSGDGGGTYLGSCSNCRVMTSSPPTLTCESCVKSDGTLNSNPSITLRDCSAADVINNDGALVCTTQQASSSSPPPPLPAAPPDGSYKRSCGNCRVLPGTPLKLHCEYCVRAGARERKFDPEIELDKCVGKDIANIDGDLRC